MTGADIPEIKALHALSFEKLAAALHDQAQIEAHRALIAEPAYDQDLRQSHLTLAIDAKGAIAGTAGWIEMPDEPHTVRIRKVFIRPDCARQGLGSRLVTDAEDRARGSSSALISTPCRST
jgi:GNAT superfamily N-acetyltransferase